MLDLSSVYDDSISLGSHLYTLQSRLRGIPMLWRSSVLARRPRSPKSVGCCSNASTFSITKDSGDPSPSKKGSNSLILTLPRKVSVCEWKQRSNLLFLGLRLRRGTSVHRTLSPASVLSSTVWATTLLTYLGAFWTIAIALPAGAFLYDEMFL